MVLCSSKKNTASLRGPGDSERYFVGFLRHSLNRLASGHSLSNSSRSPADFEEVYTAMLFTVSRRSVVLATRTRFISTVTYFALPSLAWLGKQVRLEV